MESIAALAEYLQQQTDCNKSKRKISQSRRGPLWSNQSYLPFFFKHIETLPPRYYQHSVT